MLEENLEHTFSADPYDQMGGYVKRCRGVSIFAKIENPAGQRIQKIFVCGREMDPSATYRVGFVTMQGVPPKYGRNRRELDIQAINAMENLLARGHGKELIEPPSR
ncbi:5'-nucleotidase C-terminal domain-containing protein [Mesorhizobium sp. Mes31]|uniref:5'-nucleotidase C-terminal domain-containing protein n=1 Tax=Mesorhizobium sp. Mes31 TaxID=2926017 RepID=UPI0021190198|nr:5'-nucleotidase C-terminal domain-containing protein [Mesorhizobium sp. Mes31]